MESFFEVFENVKKYCLSDPSVSEIGYNKWIKTLEPVKLENSTAYILTENEFTKKTTNEVYLDVLERGFLETLGFKVKIELLTRQQPPAVEQNGFAEVERRMEEKGDVRRDGRGLAR